MDHHHHQECCRTGGSRCERRILGSGPPAAAASSQLPQERRRRTSRRQQQQLPSLGAAGRGHLYYYYCCCICLFWTSRHSTTSVAAAFTASSGGSKRWTTASSREGRHALPSSAAATRMSRLQLQHSPPAADPGSARQLLERKPSADSSNLLCMVGASSSCSSANAISPNMFLASNKLQFSGAGLLQREQKASAYTLPPEMRLKSPLPGAGGPEFDGRGSGPFSVLRVTGRHRNRGVLGFRMDDRGDDVTAAAGNPDSMGSSERRKDSSLSSSRTPSNVDTVSWNLPDGGFTEQRKHRVFLAATEAPPPLPLAASAAGGGRSPSWVADRGAREAPSSVATSSNGGDGLVDSTVFSWFPWIPTRTQIDSLNGADELRMACAERGLPHSGSSTAGEMRDRLWQWSAEQQKIAASRQRQSLSFLRRMSGGIGPYGLGDDHEEVEVGLKGAAAAKSSAAKPATKRGDGKSGTKKRKGSEGAGRLEANSLAEWTRTVDLEPLLQRREAIHREKNQGKIAPSKRQRQTRKKEPPTLEELTKAFLREPSKSNNVQVKELYLASKHADQRGERELAKSILLQLKETTPHDARIYRRLARMESEEGNVGAARAVLQEGLRLHPNNAYLWHGLSQVAATDHDAKACLRRAIQADPTFPNPYHALGTLEHSHGRVAVAMKTLKKGLEYCPKNHRLHHALGDLYRDAKVLDMAEKSYRKALKHSPHVSHGFALTALAYVAYEQGQVDKCRSRLREALSTNNGRHANAWLALAQMEEAEGNIDAARAVCISGLAKYERGLLERSRNIKFKKKEDDLLVTADPVALRNKFLKKVPVYRSGDRFYNVYRNWARLEERHGTIESVEEVYERATSAFPYEWRLYVDWAQYYAKLRLRDKARATFSDACAKTANRHADPYRYFAEFEMSQGNYADARKILYQGSVAMTQSPDGALGNRCGLPELFYTWAVCEWHLGELSRAEVLFEHALRMTNDGEEGAKLRSLILYSIARLEHFQGEYLLAQHSIGLCLKENLMPGGNSKVWDLWAEVALAMGNKKLANECFKQAEEARSHEDENGSSGLASASGLSRMKGQDIKGLMRRDPWYHKIFGTNHSSDFFRGSRLPNKAP